MVLSERRVVERCLIGNDDTVKMKIGVVEKIPNEVAVVVGLGDGNLGPLRLELRSEAVLGLERSELLERLGRLVFIDPKSAENKDLFVVVQEMATFVTINVVCLFHYWYFITEQGQTTKGTHIGCLSGLVTGL